MAFSILSEETKMKLAEDLHKFTIEFKQVFGLDCFLTCGTLVGAVREGDFLSHDSDMDVHYLSKCSEFGSVFKESMEIWNYFKSQKKAIFKSTHGKGLQMHIAFDPDFYDPAEQHHEYHNIKRCPDGHDYCHVDLFGSWIGNDKSHYFSCFGSRVWQCKIENMVLPLRPFKFKGFDFYVPNRTEDFLTFQFGDWRVKQDGDWRYWPPGEVEYEISKGSLWELWTNNKEVYIGESTSPAKKYIRLNEDGTVDWANGRLKIIADFIGKAEIVFWSKEENAICLFDQNKKQIDQLIKIDEDQYESTDKIMKRAKK